MSTTTVPMSIKIDPSLRERLSHLAASRKRTPHALAREAIEQYVLIAESRDRANQEAVAAYEHYQETGLHVTGEEVTKWMQSWGTEDEQPAPQCHV